MGGLAAHGGRSLGVGRGRAARPGAGRGKAWGSNARLCVRLRLSSPAVLSRRARRETRYAPSSLRSNSPDEHEDDARLRRAARRPALLGSLAIRPRPCPARHPALPGPLRVASLCAPPRSLQGCGWALPGVSIETPEKRSAFDRAPWGALRELTHRDCSSAATKERSEFRGGSKARASQGTRGAAERNGSIPNPRKGPPADLPQRSLRTARERPQGEQTLVQSTFAPDRCATSRHLSTSAAT